MIDRIKEIKKCLQNDLYEAALALALTLPDICGQVEYPGLDKVGIRYKDWINKYLDKKVLYDDIFGSGFIPLTGEEIYKLRCSLFHSGNDDIRHKVCKIDEFKLLSPTKTDGEYGYRYGIRTNADGTETHIAEIDINYLCEMICNAALEYYKTRKPEEFDEHTFKIVK